MIERRSAYLKASTCRSTVGWHLRAYLPSVALNMLCCPMVKISRWSADDRATVGLSESVNLSIVSWVTIAGISPERRLTHDLLPDRENLSLIGRWSSDGRTIWKHQLVDRQLGDNCRHISRASPYSCFVARYWKSVADRPMIERLSAYLKMLTSQKFIGDLYNYYNVTAPVSQWNACFLSADQHQI